MNYSQLVCMVDGFCNLGNKPSSVGGLKFAIAEPITKV